MYAARYLNELIDYGDIPTTRAEAILDIQRMGVDQGCIDRWLQGYELGERLRDRHVCLTTRIFLAEPT
jgi:hypothetical protein